MRAVRALEPLGVARRICRPRALRRCQKLQWLPRISSSSPFTRFCRLLLFSSVLQAASAS